MMATRPDFVVVMTDQQRHDQVGFASGGHFETPNLDAMAQRGVTFTTAYSASTTCIPARNALLTGIQPHRLPRQHNRLALKEGVWTIAHALRSSGYQTALIGKMHFTPMHGSHGFDVMRTSEHLNASFLGLRPDGSPDLDDYHEWLVGEGLASWSTLVPGKPPEIVKAEAPPEATDLPFPYELRYHATSWVEREATAYLATRDRSRPLFLVVSFPHPHPPLNPLEPYRSLYQPADAVLPRDGFDANDTLPDDFRAAMTGSQGRFAAKRAQSAHGLQARLTKTRALVRHIDHALGRVLQHLDDERSVIIYTSDHGDYGGHRGLVGKVPWISFDDLLRVPLVITGAGIDRLGTVDVLVQTSDLPLTCCELAGIDVPVEQFDSESLSPFLVDGGRPAGDDRLVVFTTNMGWPGARHGALKLIRHRPTWSTVLFDLDEDPGETVNRADDRAYRDARGHLDAALDAAYARPAPELESFGKTPSV